MPTDQHHPSMLGQIRESLTAARELVIVMAIVLLVAWPSLVKSCLERAGIRSIAGLEFDWEELVAANEETQMAEETVNNVVVELQSVSQQLNELSQQRNPDSSQLAALSSNLANLESKAREADAILSRSITTRDKLIKSLPPNAKGYSTQRTRDEIKEASHPKPQSVKR